MEEYDTGRFEDITPEEHAVAIKEWKEKNPCPHPETRRGDHLINTGKDPSKMYCLACGEAV